MLKTPDDATGRTPVISLVEGSITNANGSVREGKGVVVTLAPAAVLTACRQIVAGCDMNIRMKHWRRAFWITEMERGDSEMVEINIWLTVKSVWSTDMDYIYMFSAVLVCCYI